VPNFLDKLYSTSVIGDRVDHICWKLSGLKIFQVRSYYQALSTKDGVIFPWKCIWRLRVPPRVTFFIWTLAWRKILTVDYL
jgi:hypothetical protein